MYGACICIRYEFPVILGKEMWVYIAFVYIFLAAVLPMWFVMQPRDYMSTFMFVGMIAGAVLGFCSRIRP